MQDVVFSKYTIDFTRVAVEYCMLLEKTKKTEKKIFINNMTKVLPLLYIKASIIPKIKEYYKSNLELVMSNALYLQIESSISDLLGNDNLYLEVFKQETKYSSSLNTAKVSKDLANIYQNLGNFISVFKNGDKKIMSDSLMLCIENFKKCWGQHLVNALKAMHFVKYKIE
ncbi:MAG: DUF5063 domain-containing protein [Bacteroidales bacterium OttesenSCG-928-I14]|jgi:hypothetical protein|nr:DUF5063 domain-containing protein [Bacteroidales bacterium OttesenSCG-928-I14]